VLLVQEFRGGTEGGNLGCLKQRRGRASDDAESRLGQIEDQAQKGVKIIEGADGGLRSPSRQLAQKKAKPRIKTENGAEGLLAGKGTLIQSHRGEEEP